MRGAKDEEKSHNKFIVEFGRGQVNNYSLWDKNSGKRDSEEHSKKEWEGQGEGLGGASLMAFTFESSPGRDSELS